MLPVVLTIAGSDCSAGAGLQADLKTITALGAYGLTAVTCVVSEVPGRVNAVVPVPPEIVADQVRLLREHYPIAVIKTGMLHSRATVEAVCEVLDGYIVVDPVMVASSGDPLIEPDAVEAYRKHLLPKAFIVTPNMNEAAVLWGRPVKTPEDMSEAGRALCGEYGCAFLIKGGHLEGKAADLLVKPNGEEFWFRTPRVEGVSTHGTGCTLSAAIAAELALGSALHGAVAKAKRYITAAIAQSHRWKNTEALNHSPA